VAAPSGGGATLAPGYYRAGLQPATPPADSVTNPVCTDEGAHLIVAVSFRHTKPVSFTFFRVNRNTCHAELMEDLTQYKPRGLR